MAPQRKKARGTKEDQPKSAEAEVTAEQEAEQEEVVQMRDPDGGKARHQPAREQRAAYPPGYENWSSSRKSHRRQRRKDK